MSKTEIDLVEEANKNVEAAKDRARDEEVVLKLHEINNSLEHITILLSSLLNIALGAGATRR